MNKRENIIVAAMDIFIEKGIEKTTISDIVRKAGIAQGTFYLYFPSKMALMPAIAEVLVARMHKRLQNEVVADNLVHQLEEVIDIIFDFTYEYKELTKLMYIGLVQTDHVNDWETIYAPVYRWMEDLLDSAYQSGHVGRQINTGYVSRIMIGMIESAAEQDYLFAEQKKDIIEEHQKELRNFVISALNLT